MKVFSRWRLFLRRRVYFLLFSNCSFRISDKRVFPPFFVGIDHWSNQFGPFVLCIYVLCPPEKCSQILQRKEQYFATDDYFNAIKKKKKWKKKGIQSFFIWFMEKCIRTSAYPTTCGLQCPYFWLNSRNIYKKKKIRQWLGNRINRRKCATDSLLQSTVSNYRYARSIVSAQKWRNGEVDGRIGAWWQEWCRSTSKKR